MKRTHTEREAMQRPEAIKRGQKLECLGHEPDHNDWDAGRGYQTVYCDGSCRPITHAAYRDH